VNKNARSMAAALLLWAPLAGAHHAMDSMTPATLLQGLLSGLAHPVLGLDHLAFIVASGVLAAAYAHGWLLPVIFVVASFHGAAFHVNGLGLPGSEWWIGLTLLVMAVVMIRRAATFGWGTVVLFAIAGYAHGHALAETIVGAEATPLAAYFAGLIVIQITVATAAYAASQWFARRRLELPLLRAAGAAAALAGATVIALAIA
jgi:urease accessory protein